MCNLVAYISYLQKTSKKRKKKRVGVNELQTESGTPIKLTQRRFTSNLERIKRKKRSTKNNKRKTKLLNIDHFRSEYGPVLGPFVTEFCTMTMMSKLKKRVNYTSYQKWLSSNVLVTSGGSGYASFRKMFHTPCVKTLKDYIYRIKCGPGLHPVNVHTLKTKMNSKKDHEKLCWLMMDEIKLRTGLHFCSKNDKIVGFCDDGNRRTQDLANNCLVIQICGLTRRWKHCIAFYLSKSTFKSDKLKEILIESIHLVEKVGFEILGVTSDQGVNFEQLFDSRLNVTEFNPKFSIGKKEYLVYRDVPHLLKSARNYLYNGNVNVPYMKHAARWEHIKDLLEVVECDALRMAPKLNRENVENLNFASKMKVKHACNVLSNTVAASLEVLVSENKMTKEVLSTSKYCKTFNDLFDVMNSCTSLDSVPLRRPLTAESEGEVVLVEALNWLHELENCNKGNRHKTKFIKGFRQSIRVVQLLLEEFQKRNLHYLSTRRLCQDLLEAYFGKIRSITTNPTPHEFIDDFAKVNVASLMTAPLNSNCEEKESLEQTGETLRLLDNVSEKLL